MKRTEQVNLDGVTYSITQYPATRGQQLLVKLMKVFGKSLGLLADQAKGGVDLMSLEVTSVIEALVANLEPEESTALIKEILTGTQVHDGGHIREINFDLDFAGRYLHLGKLLKEVLVFQYGDFLGGLATLGQGAARKNPQPAVSAST